MAIKTGINDDYYTEITEGDIDGNDKVVVESYVTNQKNDGPSFALPQPKRF